MGTCRKTQTYRVRVVQVVRVAITFKKDGADNGVAYASYCYSPEGKLVRLQSGPLTQVACDDAYFQCQLTFGVTSFYLSTSRLIAKILQGSAPRALKSERTSFSWVERMPPLYLTIYDLPFDAALHKSAKTDVAPLAINPARRPAFSSHLIRRLTGHLPQTTSPLHSRRPDS